MNRMWNGAISGISVLGLGDEIAVDLQKFQAEWATKTSVISMAAKAISMA